MLILRKAYQYRKIRIYYGHYSWWYFQLLQEKPTVNTGRVWKIHTTASGEAPAFGSKPRTETRPPHKYIALHAGRLEQQTRFTDRVQYLEQQNRHYSILCCEACEDAAAARYGYAATVLPRVYRHDRRYSRLCCLGKPVEKHRSTNTLRTPTMHYWPVKIIVDVWCSLWCYTKKWSRYYLNYNRTSHNKVITSRCRYTYRHYGNSYRLHAYIYTLPRQRSMAIARLLSTKETLTKAIQ